MSSNGKRRGMVREGSTAYVGEGETDVVLGMKSVGCTDLPGLVEAISRADFSRVNSILSRYEGCRFEIQATTDGGVVADSDYPHAFSGLVGTIEVRDGIIYVVTGNETDTIPLDPQWVKKIAVRPAEQGAAA